MGTIKHKMGSIVAFYEA